LYIVLVLVLEKINILKKPHPFARSIKGTVLGRTLWGGNTFPRRNWLPNLKFGLL